MSYKKTESCSNSSCVTADSTWSIIECSYRINCAVERSSPTTIRNHFTELQTTLNLLEPSTENRGRGNVKHPLHQADSPSLEVEIFIHDKLHQVKLHNQHQSASTLTAALREQFNIEISKKKMLRWLHELGYSYGNKRFMGGLKPAQRFARLRSFIYQYASALREEQQQKSVIVYTDESYILTRHCAKQLWFSETSLTKADVQGDDNGGKRLILIHAMTRDGLLAEKSAVASNFLLDQSTTCEFVFETLSSDGDYHSTVDSNTYFQWVKNRLITTFKTMHPNKQMILVFDNASYHRHRGSDWYSSSTMSRVQLISYLNAHHIETMTVNRDTVETTMTVPSINSRGSKTTPTVNELRTAVKQHLYDNPQHNATEVEKEMKKHGYRIIYTPPFTPEVQPIELLWGTVKRQVAEKAVINRTIQQTKQQVEEAFQAVDEVACNSLIQHCHKWIDTFIQSDEAGSLKQYGSLQKLIETDVNTTQSTAADAH